MNDEKQPEKVGKKAIQSKTIRVGSFYIGAGVVVAALQIFGGLQEVLKLINVEGLDTDQAAWLGLILAIIGAIQVYLRTITSEPIE